MLGASAGGIARHVSQVTSVLDGTEGLVVDVACPPDLPIAMPKESFDLRIPNGVRGHPDAIKALRRLVRDGSYDVVHAHGLRAGVDAAVAARRHCPVIATVHNLVRPEIAGAVRARLDRLAEPLVVRLADRTLAVSQEIADRLKTAAPGSARKIEVMYLGVGEPPEVRRDRAEVRRELSVPGDRSLAVTVARLAPQKALHVMLQALAMAKTSPTLAILGEGPLEPQLREEARRLSLEHRVRFLGFRSDVADVVAAADVFCLSSVWEGVPLSVQEAILLGVPVVSTDVGGMNEIVVDGHSGRLVAYGDTDALAAAVDEICGSPQIATLYAERALTDLRVRFSTKAMLERLRVLYGGGARAG